jgi:TRAP-type mannitol/chloroaromatic compound transport system substrate-binding protein
MSRQTARSPRRRFLKSALGVAGGSAALAFPAITKAQGTIALRWQSAWREQDIFHEFAQDAASKVNEMTGGDLRIEVLPAEAVVPPAGLLDAVSKGTLDGAHGVLGNHYAKQDAFALWSAGPAFGMDANMLLAWHKYGGGRELLGKLYGAVGANVVSFPYGPMPTQPMGWFHAPVKRTHDFKGMKFRAVGLPSEIFGSFGASVQPLAPAEIVQAMASGQLDAAQFRNPTSDRGLGLSRVAKVCMVQSYHRNAQLFEILFNQTKFEALPRKIRSIIGNAVEAASSDMSWKAIDRYSRDYEELGAKEKVRFLKTPDSILRAQLKAYDAAIARRKDNALLNEIVESQKRFAMRAVKWDLESNVGRRMAYGHYFGRKPRARTRRKS